MSTNGKTLKFRAAKLKGFTVYISSVVTMFQKIFMFIPITRVMISGELT